MKKTYILTLIALQFFFCHCQREMLGPTQKYLPQDPFKTSITQSQFFDVDAGSAQLIEGKDGTRLFFPQGCFLRETGEMFTLQGRVELTEALHLSDILGSNLTTTAKGKLLETGGMLYFNVTSSQGEQLRINPRNPIYIEIPTPHRKANMQVFEGNRDENGNMDWVNPKELEHNLTSVDIFSLDFLPPGFYDQVEKALPFGNYREVTQALVDSLYYSLAHYRAPELVNTNINEPYHNPNSKVENGKYTEDSYNTSEHQAAHESDTLFPPAINPAIIKTIKSNQFQNTLIATREFQKRLSALFRTCDNAVLEIYIDHLDKNLWELDEMASKKIIDPTLKQIFQDFAAERLGKVNVTSPYAKLLKDYYRTALAKVSAALKEKQSKLDSTLRQKNAGAKQIVDEYKEVLQKREKYRMESYGFQWTNTGWINVDNGTIPKDWGPQGLEIYVENSSDFDRVYTYVLYTSMKSLYRLNSEDKSHFHVGNTSEKEMNMPKKKNALAIAIGYKGEDLALVVRDFETGTDRAFSLRLLPGSLEKVKEALASYDDYSEENNLLNDLGYMNKLYVEAQRQKMLIFQANAMKTLHFIAFPCYNRGELLFKASCATCHTMNVNMTGPALCGAENRWSAYPKSDLYAFIRNSQQSIRIGQPRAVKLWTKYKPTLMNSLDLSDAEIQAILDYVDSQCLQPQ